MIGVHRPDGVSGPRGEPPNTASGVQRDLDELARSAIIRAVPMFQNYGACAEFRPRLSKVLRDELLLAYHDHVGMIGYYLTSSAWRDAQRSDVIAAERHAQRARAIARGLVDAGEPAPVQLRDGKPYDFEAALRMARWPDPRKD